MASDLREKLERLVMDGDRITAVRRAEGLRLALVEVAGLLADVPHGRVWQALDVVRDALAGVE